MHNTVTQKMKTDAWYRSITTSFLHAWTRAVTRGISRVKCKSFPWKILFPCDKMWHFHVTRHGIPRDETWHFHKTSHSIYTQRGQPNGIQEKPTTITTTYIPCKCSYLQLKPVSECPV